MIPAAREDFNNRFTAEIYREFLDDLNRLHPGAIDFRIAETPLFIPKPFAAQMIETCEHIIDFILSEPFTALTDKAIPAADFVPGENGHCHFLAFDFGVCRSATGAIEPRLIEMQGFPSLYGFQVPYPEILAKHFPAARGFTQYLGRYDRESFLQDFRSILLGDSRPEHVILLDIKPDQQKTRIDFYCTQDLTGVRPVCLTEIVQEGRALYYFHPDTGKKIRIERIYNRLIFDELHARSAGLGPHVDIRQSFDVTWVSHPNWFYRVSKYCLPYLDHPCVPETAFLNELKQPPASLADYVLKPLFSFAGQGVIIDVTQADIDAIADPENWILQRKVDYASIIKTPGEPAKAEVRIMYLWKEGEARPRPAINLARLSKGKMIGVRYNKDKDWVGGSVALF